MKLLNMLLLFVFFNLFISLTVSETAFADDELYLCGVVKEVNTKEGMVRIEVTSEGCAGEKIFKVPQVQELNRFLVGEARCFMINTNTCPQQQIATILAE